MVSKIEFSPACIRAMYTTIAGIAPDVSYADLKRPKIVAELVMDANRLHYVGGSKVADDEVTELVKVHGWPAVVLAVSKILGAYA